MTQMLYSTHQAVRLYPPDATGVQWKALHLSNLKQYKINPLTALLLVEFTAATDLEQVVEKIKSQTSLSGPVIRQHIQKLQELHMLVDPEDESHRFASSMFQQWAEKGWLEAADYHYATLDYPFLDYATEGFSEDIRRTGEYLSHEPDQNRSKTHPNAQQRHPVPQAKAHLENLQVSLKDAWERQAGPATLTAERLEELSSIAFGKLRQRNNKRYGDVRAPQTRKTSPSGGGRHPTEGYVVVLDVEGYRPGVYHFCVENNSLDYIGEAPERSEAENLFTGARRAPFQARAYVVLTSMFERNMYRYREPRTFRTVWMDAGHMVATIEFTCFARGIPCFPQYALQDSQVETLLGVDGLQEGTVCAIALG